METSKFTNMLHKKTNKITKILTYVVLEWTLIFLLLINSIFSYLILKFALYFGLKPPCLFCSRIDHVINSTKNTKKNTIFSSYTKLICDHHASEISNFGYCPLHSKLTELKNLCDDCSSTNLVGTHEAPLLKWMNDVGFGGEIEVKNCSCCDSVMNDSKKVCDAANYIDYMANLIAERELNGCFLEQEHGDLVVDQRDFVNFDQFDSGYKVLDDVDDDGDDEEIDDDDDEEIDDEDDDVKKPLLSKIDDNIDINNLCSEMLQHHLEFYVDHDDYRLIPVEIEGNSVKTEGKCEESEKIWVKNDEKVETLEEICEEEVDFVIEKDDLIMGCSSKNLPSIQEEEEEVDEEVSVAAAVAEAATVAAQEAVAVAAEEAAVVVVEEKSEIESSPVSKDYEEHLSRDDYVTNEELIEVDEHSIINEIEVCEVANSSIEVSALSTDENDDAKVDVVEKNMGVSTETNEETLNLNVDVDSSNNVIIEGDKISDKPNSTESLNMHEKTQHLGIDGSGVKSDQNVQGGDAATLIEKLKDEVENERKTLRAVYKELEEERNAAAVAANQTLAMINRLQEEKATMQMEALQYQRMMEEQSEYDQEALQMMNELMVKREKEKLELEKELDIYRKKLLDFEEREKVRILARRMEGSIRSRNSSASCSFGEESDGLSVDLNHDTKEEDGGENGHNDTPVESVLNLQQSLGCFEDERQSILEQLKVLEEKLFTLAEEEEEEEEEEETDRNARQFDEGFYEENGKHEEGWINSSMQKRLLPLFDEAELSNSPDMAVNINKLTASKFELEKKRLAIEEEVDHVYERLHALEADREFLKHCIGSLRKGDKGLDLLQEILQHLRDLKNVELQVMKNSV